MKFCLHEMLLGVYCVLQISLMKEMMISILY